MVRNNPNKRIILLALNWGILLVLVASQHRVGRQAHALPTRFKRTDQPTLAQREQWKKELASQQDAMKGGEHFKPLKLYVEFPGLEPDELEELCDLDLPEDTAVVGICVGDQACAFVLSSMSDPMKHIANLVFNGKSLSVAYCDLVDTVRVCSAPSSETIPLHVGGLDIDDQLVLLYKGVRYGQESPALPLADYDFERTTAKEWLHRHPGSKAYVAPEVDW